jgi:hypothetical protein
MYRNINAQPFSQPESKFDPGPAPSLRWVEIDQLVVDPAYQREIGRRGSQNVQLIAEYFEWSKFAPVIIAPLEGGLFAIVDGQHRTTAAALRGVKEVPCQVVLADRTKQAQAYAAVNAAVTKTTPQQLFHAKIAAEDPIALEIADVCSIGGVEILRRSSVKAKIKTGQTAAVSALAKCLKRYGRNTLITALQCITQTSDGNPGFVRPTIVEVLCSILDRSPEWREAGDLLLRAMDDFEFADAWEETMAGRNFVLSPAVTNLFAEKVTKHLNSRLGAPARLAAE